MRKAIPIGAALALAAALAFGLWPFHPHEVRTLLPVQAFYVERTATGVAVTTDNGLSGEGPDWDAALAALAAAAPGEVFYGTAGVAFLQEGTLLDALVQDENLRPAIRLYRGAPPVDLADAPAWAAVRERGQAVTLGAVRAGRNLKLPEAGV